MGYFPDESEEYEEPFDSDESYEEEPSEYEPSRTFCPSCRREISPYNRWINTSRSNCEGCETDGMRRFVLLDLFMRWFF